MGISRSKEATVLPLAKEHYMHALLSQRYDHGVSVLQFIASSESTSSKDIGEISKMIDQLVLMISQPKSLKTVRVVKQEETTIVAPPRAPSTATSYSPSMGNQPKLPRQTQQRQIMRLQPPLPSQQVQAPEQPQPARQRPTPAIRPRTTPRQILPVGVDDYSSLTAETSSTRGSTRA